jgi:hypothetical protein
VSEEDDGVDWDRPTEGADLVDLSPALDGAKLETLTDAPDKRRLAMRFDAPRVRRAGAMGKDVRFVFVVDGVRSKRASDWIAGDAGKASDYASGAELLAARRRLGRTESIGWAAFVGELEKTKLDVAHAVLLRNDAGVALRVAGTMGRDWRELVVAGELAIVRRSDREPFDLEMLLAHGGEE